LGSLSRAPFFRVCYRITVANCLTSALIASALVHRQFPVGSNVIEAQDVEVAVAGLDLEIAIVRAMPLIDVLGHIDSPIIETESPKFFNAVFIDIGVNANNLHGVPSVSSRWTR
jgi:hypothetical protein